MPHRYRFPQAVEEALVVLDQSELGRVWANYLRESRIGVVFNSTLGGPGGTTWLGWRIYFPASMRTYLEPDRLVHELVHTTQAPYLFGSLEHERAAYIVQYQYLASVTGSPPSLDFYMDVVRNLQTGGDAAYDWIRERGPYYHSFPVENPRLRDVRAWAPQVRYAVSVSWQRARGNVSKG